MKTFWQALSRVGCIVGVASFCAAMIVAVFAPDPPSKRELQSQIRALSARVEALESEAAKQ